MGHGLAYVVSRFDRRCSTDVYYRYVLRICTTDVYYGGSVLRDPVKRPGEEVQCGPVSEFGKVR